MKKDVQIYKKWFYIILSVSVLVVMTIGIANYIVDPYFHYHKPILSYELNEERYINDGISRNFDYDSIIIGNSLTQNFKTTQYDELFDSHSVKLPYSGGGYKELWEAIDRAIGYNPELSNVLVSFDLDDLFREAGWMRYSDLPSYLYDDNIFNDIYYLLNKEVFYRGTVKSIMRTIRKTPSTSMDEYSSWTRPTGTENALSSLSVLKAPSEYEERALYSTDIDRILTNVSDNILNVVNSNPNVEFTLIIPPSSIAKWAEYYSEGQLEYRIHGLEWALPELLQCSNVRIYAFDDAFDLTTNLDRYSDTIHYDAGINEWILDEISLDNHRLTIDNYSDYINTLRLFYETYDYTSLNEYIDG